MNNIKCLYALSSTCRGTAWTHTVLPSLHQSTDLTLLPEVLQTISQSQVVPPSNNPAIHKKQIRLLPRKMPGDWYPWQKSMCAGWGVRVFLCFPKSRWWWLRGPRLAPGGPGSDPQGEPPGTPCLRGERSRNKAQRRKHGFRLLSHIYYNINYNIF